MDQRLTKFRTWTFIHSPSCHRIRILAEELLVSEKQTSGIILNMKKKLIRPTAKEDATITKAANSDPDSRPFTDKQWAKVKPNLIRGRDRLLGSGTKEQVTQKLIMTR